MKYALLACALAESLNGRAYWRITVEMHDKYVFAIQSLRIGLQSGPVIPIAREHHEFSVLGQVAARGRPEVSGPAKLCARRIWDAL